MQSLLSKKVFARTALVFLTAYFISLLIWLPIKDGYGYVTTSIASKLAAGLTDAKVEEISSAKNVVEVTFTPLRKRPDMLVDIPVRISSYTFNMPLTVGIMAALYPFITRRAKAYGQALVMLFGVHLLFVFSLETKELTEVFMSQGLIVTNTLRIAAHQFLWQFVDNMVIRFEPFLIGFYVFLRFGIKKEATD
jgi:hypothetical protein